MREVEMLNVITTLYITIKSLLEVFYLVRDMDRGEFIYWDKLHSLQHIALILWWVVISIMLLAYKMNCFGIFIYNIYIALFLIPHFSYERDGRLANFK